MSDIAIRVDGLGKRYHLGGQQERYHTFADQIKKWTSLRRLFNRVRRAESKPPFWALRDVSFEVKRGEVVGIIGRNGAGKSTLLKILSRITEPTEGEATIYGRVGSLLEVGTGFHPELTGRENIFLNGAILGMKRAEILRKFDEIVSFAEVEKFIDTPAKHYSSGMYMRLAFAVAAHLEPEILVVDEVLAVGDAQFQNKCLGKMQDVADSGRTVLFVSHNMGAVNRLTTRCVLLSRGEIVLNGSPASVIREYLDIGLRSSSARVEISSHRRPNRASDEVTIRDVYVCTKAMERTRTVQTNQQIMLVAEVEAKRPISGAALAFTLFNSQQDRVVQVYSYDQNVRLSLQSGIQMVACELPVLSLAPGDYFVDADIAQASDTLCWDVLLKVPVFTVTDELGGLEWRNRRWGCLHLENVQWSSLPRTVN